MTESNHRFLFPLGRTVMTPGTRELMHRTGTHPFQLLLRHQCGDWGVLDTEDRAANDRAVIEGTRLLSVYIVGRDQQKIWVISESDRCVTTILCPSEY